MERPLPRELKFLHIDFWNRPVFKDQYGNYFGSVEKLFDYGTDYDTLIKTFSESDIVYFGSDLDCDPDGSPISASKIKLVSEFSNVGKD